MILDSELIKAGFRVPSTPKGKRLVVCTRALDKKGKTHWALDKTPPPVAVIALDTGTKEIADKFVGKKELICRYHSVTGSTGDRGETQQIAEKEWAEVKNSYLVAVSHPKVRTLVVDTTTEMWELLRLARFGRLESVLPHHYGPVNKEMRDLVKRAYERDDLNVILVHKLKKQYAQNKKGEDSWNGKYEMAGYGDIPYLVDLTLDHYWHEAERDEAGNVVQPARFGVRVIGVSRQTPDVCGLELEGDDCNFLSLALCLYPEAGMECWL